MIYKSSIQSDILDNRLLIKAGEIAVVKINFLFKTYKTIKIFGFPFFHGRNIT